MIIALQTLIFFRESLLTALDRLLRPYYNKFSLSFNSFNNDSDDEESEEQVFAEYDDEKGVVFYPPMYAQRYAAVSDCLLDERWAGKLEKVVDLGHHDMSFIKYLKDVPGIQCILGVDIESIPLRCSSDLLGCDDYIPKRENPLLITLFQGNAADPDYRLIGCDAVIAIEMIEHMMPHDLDRLIHTVFGFIKPWIVIFTTPNGDFNVLFKSLEKNGLRRLDHFFEWSREQFNDWCSNIVVRYPQYTVTCKGIGPGPSDTVHLGCCTQMALFVNKNYHKQQDLSLNSLALVANAPSQNNFCDVIDNWEVPELITESNMLFPPSNMESYTEFIFSEKQSRINTVNTTPKFSIESIVYQDKTSQCNLDSELGKNFLMFDYEQMYFNILVPRRKYDNKVYEIEDVASRLNCTTLQVKKFSKTTQNLMAKNKSDTLVHTREVVDEIRNLTKMLNFNKDSVNHTNETPMWCNINWGDNAPYWNQYYKIVREYNYPFQVKSDDSRILDLISEEINSTVDTYCDDENSADINKMKIPLHYLMKSVRHITEDMDRVKDLLEWNGYEIVDDVVIYTRLVDTASVATYEDDWIDNDTLSDWDTTDCHSTSLSDGSNVVPDYNGRCLRRALDHKLRKLRSMLTADEDISSELDRVVCRLMKLALRTSKGRETPPPTRWMQCKLLDLLTLTEKSIDRRKRHFIETYPLMPVGFDDKIKSKDMVTLEKIKRDDITIDVVNKYSHLFSVADKHCIYEDVSRPKYGNIDLELEDDLSETSVEFLKDYEYINGPSPDLVYSEVDPSEKLFKPQLNEDEYNLKSTQAWIEEDVEVIPYPNHDYDHTSGDTDQSINDTLKQRYKKCYKKHKNNKIDNDVDFAINESYYQRKCKVRSGDKNKKKEKMRNIKVIKKLNLKNSSYGSLLKSSSSKYLTIKIGNYRAKYKKYRGISLINNGDDKTLILNGYQDKTAKDDKEYLERSIINNCVINYNISKEIDYDVSATEESYFINIIMDGKEETIALRRTIGTDADVDLAEIETETQIHNIHEDLKDIYVKHEVSTENVQSQTIFLNDINEPSTSKGIRHSVSTDVQCGPDETVPIYSTLSATTSFTKLPKTCRNGIQIGDSCTDVRIDSTDFGTCTHECNVYGTVTPRKRSPGIQIQDSNKNIYAMIESATTTQELPTQINLVTTNYALNETQLLKAVSNNMKNEDSSPEFCDSDYSIPKSPFLYPNSVKTSVKEVEVADDLLIQESVRPKLSCGGVHIHTYKEKQISEDVVFQGEWQKYKPKPYVKRKPVNSFVAKKGIEPVNKRKKVNSKEKLAHKIPLHKSAIKNLERTHAEANIKPKLEIKRRENPPISRSTTLKSVKPVKVASKLSLRSKIPKVTFAKTSVVLPYVPVEKKFDEKQNILKKNYLPLYLRKNYIALHANNKKCFNSSKDKVQTHITKHEELSSTKRANLERSKAEEIKKDLLKFKYTPIKKFEYLVFHNKIENKGSTSNNQSTTNKVNSRMENIDNKLKSPTSQNSSTCSSPSSIATVRRKKVKNLSSKRNSTCSNNLCNFDETDSGTPSPTRPKKYAKRCKSVKKVEDSIINNKENIPESPTKYNNIKENVKSSKSVFMGSQKSVYMAQLESSVNTITKSRTQSNKSSIKIPIAETKNEKQLSSTSLILEKPKDDVIATPYNYSMNNISKFTEYESKEKSAENVVKNKSVNRLMEGYDIPTMSTNNMSNNSLDNKTSISKIIKMLIDETLEIVGEPIYDDSTFDSATVILSHEDMNPSYEDCMSLASFKSVNTNEDIFESILESDLENALNRTFDSTLSEESVINLAETNFAVTDVDLLSFKSVPSVSKMSEYILKNNELKMEMTSNNSVRELFERKDQTVNKNIGGVLAIQAFSGFSINSEPVVGDQPDHVNFIDSETGSMTQEFARQATSEELFVSGRSSDSYESCLIEEDAVVPNWLFQIISQQQSITEEAQSLPLADPMPLDISVPHAEPLYDANGNPTEPGVSAASGAGDGRGIHSDHSQDSSGQGSSLSSSNTSSEPQSEAIIIDASAFTNQFGLLGEPIGSTIVIPSLNDATGEFENFLSVAEGPENETITLRIPTEGPTRHHAAAASDDADVSSLDTDVPDSSD